MAEATPGVSKDEQEIFVTGRLCLFGEHTDWAGEYRLHNPEILPGRTLVVGTQEGLHATARKLDRPVLVVTASSSTGDKLGPKEFPLDDLKGLVDEASKGTFWSYIAGTAYRLAVYHKIGGLELDNHTSTLPMSKGLSSSAAICVLVARAFNRIYDLKLTTRGEMELAYLGEITTPSKCGRMDQACAYGGVPVCMVFDADILHIDPVKLSTHLHLVLVDLKAKKDTTTILRSLQGVYPRPADARGEALLQLLGQVNQSITERALAAMADGDAAAVGALMREAQMEFDARAGPVCPCQLAAPVLHRVLDHAALQPLIWGGKGVGSQGDGTAQLLCRGGREQEEVCRIVTEDLGMEAHALTILPNAGPAAEAAAVLNSPR